MAPLADRPNITFEAIFLLSHPEATIFGIVIFGWVLPGDISYWIFNYMPHWEAASKEARTLLRTFGAQYTTRLFSLNQNRRVKWHGQERYLPLLAAPAAFALLYQAARAHRINHLFSSGGERLLAPRLAGPASIITICKEPGSIDALERNRRHLARFAYVVVETRRHREILEQCGIDRRRIKLIHPPAATAPYARARPPFKILFASSPPAPNQFLSRGIFLILRVAARLPEVQFVLVWRDRHHDALLGLIEDAGVGNVSVINGYVEDMGALYDTVHATVLAGHEHTSFKPAPHSALESLGRGKPVLVTPTSSIAALVAERRCGIVFEASIDGFEAAIRDMMGRYDELQAGCQATVGACFSQEVFIERYRLLYEELLSSEEVRAPQRRTPVRGRDTAGAAVRP